MKLEIVLLLLTGMKPKQIAEALNTKVWNIYFYKRTLETAFLTLDRLKIKEFQNAVKKREIHYVVSTFYDGQRKKGTKAIKL